MWGFGKKGEEERGGATLPSSELQEPIRVAVCIPTYGQWTEEFRKSFAEFMYAIKEQPDGIHIAQIEPETPGAFIHLVRLGLVKLALQLEPAPDYILFLDSDMVVPFYFLHRLVSHQKDVVSARFHSRRKNYLLSASNWRRNPNDLSTQMSLWAPIDPEDLGAELVEIGACGFGCTLIKSSVFDRIEYPWFNLSVAELDTEEIPFLGEDIHFSKRCYDAGIKIYLDPQVKVGHVTDKRIIVTPDNYKELQEGIYRVG